MAAGRQTLCTPELIKEITDFIRLGQSNIDAITNAGVTSSTFYHWLMRGRTELERVALSSRAKIRKKERPYVDLVNELQKAVPQRKAMILARIQQAGKGGEVITETRVKTERNKEGQMVEVERVTVTKYREPDWRADAWLLERLHNDEYGLRAKIVHINWKDELKQLWDTGKLTREDIVNELGSELASEFFISAGIIGNGNGTLTIEGEIQ